MTISPHHNSLSEQKKALYKKIKVLISNGIITNGRTLYLISQGQGYEKEKTAVFFDILNELQKTKQPTHQYELLTILKELKESRDTEFGHIYDILKDQSKHAEYYDLVNQRKNREQAYESTQDATVRSIEAHDKKDTSANVQPLYWDTFQNEYELVRTSPKIRH